MDIKAMECEITADWSIDKKALHEVEVDGYFDSPLIQTIIPGVECVISMFPNDDNDDVSNVNCRLYVETDTSIDANFTFSIPSANFSETCVCKFVNSEDGDNVFICSRASLFDSKNKYFQNGKLTFQLRGTFKFNLVEDIKQGSLGQKLWEKDDKDFTIQVEDKEIKAHKFILRQFSPFFEAMFNSGMKEARESKVKFEEFSFDVVEMAIKFCYDIKHGSLGCSVDTRLSLLKFSDVYDIADLKIYVQQKLAKQLSSDNLCKIANAAIEFNADKLRLCCMLYLIKCLKNTVAISDFDSLDANFKFEAMNKVCCRKL
uniref:BTB domain-containing protein n=1 Tax=Panagrolaimus sp. ES5 TaxID=591445 RepID=A0AC34FKP5_9BILA